MKHEKPTTSEIVSGDLRPTLKSRLSRLRKNLKAVTKKQLVIGGVALAVLTAGVIGYLVFQNPQEEPSSGIQAYVCDGTKVRQSSAQIAAFNVATNEPTEKKIDDMYKSANQIRAMENHENDPNCLHLLTQYYVTLGDAPEARKYLDLRLARKDAITNEFLADAETLQRSVEDVEEQYKQAQEGTRFIKGEPGAENN